MGSEKYFATRMEKCFSVIVIHGMNRNFITGYEQYKEIFALFYKG